MSTKHTPGPWKAEQVGHAQAITDKFDRPVAYTAICGHDREMEPANARLIAAAPDLLEENNRAGEDLNVIVDGIHELTKEEIIRQVQGIQLNLHGAFSKAQGGGS